MAETLDRDRSMHDGSAIVGFFRDKDDAYRAVSEMREAGFTSDQIGLAARDAEMGAAESRHDGEDRSFWQKVKGLLTGEEHDTSSREFRQSLDGMDISDERSEYYSRGITEGGALVTVRTRDRAEEARQILQECGADLRDRGFERQQPAAGTNEITDRDYRVQLRGEMLQAHKERVNRGEVRLRKEVVSENQSIEVPVTREELVVERVDTSGATPTGEIGSDKEIRVPLSEERVTVDKKPVVTGEVKVGKRQVQDTRTVSDNVRHEEVKLEKEGDVKVNEAALRDKNKDRAA